MIRWLLLCAVMPLLPCAEGYKPFGIALGTNAYELPGGYQYEKLIALGYKPLPSVCTLDGMPLTTKEEYAKFLAILVPETVELHAAEARPDLATKRAPELLKATRAHGPIDITWEYVRKDDTSTRLVTITFDGRTGIVGRVTAEISGGRDFVPDAKAMYANIITGCSRSTVDGNILLTNIVRTTSVIKRQMTRIRADELLSILDVYLAADPVDTHGGIMIDNTNPDKQRNPLGHLKAALTGNERGASIRMTNEDEELLQGDAEIRKQVADAVAATIQERQKEHDSKLKKPDAGGL